MNKNFIAMFGAVLMACSFTACVYHDITRTVHPVSVSQVVRVQDKKVKLLDLPPECQKDYMIFEGHDPAAEMVEVKIIDINHDGLEDMLMNNGIAGNGTAGTTWSIFLKKSNGRYHKTGDFQAGYFELVPDSDGSLLIVMNSRCGCAEHYIAVLKTDELETQCAAGLRINVPQEKMEYLWHSLNEVLNRLMDSEIKPFPDGGEEVKLFFRKLAFPLQLSCFQFEFDYPEDGKTEQAEPERVIIYRKGARAFRTLPEVCQLDLKHNRIEVPFDGMVTLYTLDFNGDNVDDQMLELPSPIRAEGNGSKNSASDIPEKFRQIWLGGADVKWRLAWQHNGYMPLLLPKSKNRIGLAALSGKKYPELFLEFFEPLPDGTYSAIPGFSSGYGVHFTLNDSTDAQLLNRILNTKRLNRKTEKNGMTEVDFFFRDPRSMRNLLQIPIYQKKSKTLPRELSFFNAWMPLRMTVEIDKAQKSMKGMPYLFPRGALIERCNDSRYLAKVFPKSFASRHFDNLCPADNQATLINKIGYFRR